MDYRPRRYWLRLSISAGVFVFGVVLAILSSRYEWETTGVTPERPEGFTHKKYVWGEGPRNVGFLTSIGAGLCILYYLIHTLRSLNLRAVICEKGLFYQRWGRKVPCLWTDIDSFYYARRPQWLVFSWFSHFCEINMRNGTTIRLPSPLNFPMMQTYIHPVVQLTLQVLIHALFRSPFPRTEELCKAIQREVTPAILPRVQAALKQGEKVEFGVLELNVHGLAYGTATLSWDRVEQVRIVPVQFAFDQLQIVDTDGHSWAQIWVAQIANLEVLLKVMDERLGKGAASLRAFGV
jgi:hypothetical protein